MIEYYISSNKYSLQERQTVKNGKVYDIVFRVITLNGEEKQKRLSGYSSKTLAKQAYIDFITEKCELIRNNPIKRHKEKKQELTISQLVPLYLQATTNQNKDSVIYERTNIFDRIIIPRFSKFTLKQLTTEELYKWQDELWSTKNPITNDFYSYNYLSKIRTTLSAFLSWCETRYNYPNNLQKVKKPKRRSPQRQMQIWTQEDFRRFINVIDVDINKLATEIKNAPQEQIKALQSNLKKLQEYRMFFIIAFYTGRRKGEILALTNDDVKATSIKFSKSLTRKTTTSDTFKITSTKTEKQESTPICPALEQELKIYKAQSPFFLGGNKPIHENALTRAFKKYTTLANNKPIRIHDLRHSFVSMMAHKGAPLTVCASLIGDTLTQVTKTYAHLYDNDKYYYLNKIT